MLALPVDAIQMLQPKVMKEMYTGCISEDYTREASDGQPERN